MKEKLYWENPLIIKENKEDAHTLAYPYSDFKSAYDSVVEGDLSGYVLEVQ